MRVEILSSQSTYYNNILIKGNKGIIRRSLLVINFFMKMNSKLWASNKIGWADLPSFDVREEGEQKGHYKSERESFLEFLEKVH